MQTAYIWFVTFAGGSSRQDSNSRPLRAIDPSTGRDLGIRRPPWDLDRPISVTTRRRILEWAAVPPGRHREPDHRRHVRCRRRLKTETVSTRRFGVNFRPPLTFITGLVIGDLVGHLPLPLGVARPRGLHRDRPASTASVCSATPPGTEPTPPAIRRRLSSRPTTSRTSPGSQAGHAQATRTRTTDYSGTDRVCSGSSAPETEAA